jgi:2-amino-4-hydroxy-6-hydroxymethyldihydropteridine diphosphokinase
MDKTLSNAAALKAAHASQQPFTLSNCSPLKISYRLLLAFGSNLGNRKQNLRLALNLLKKNSILISTSRWEQTEPLKSDVYLTENHENYVNFIAEIQTHHHPYRFYKEIIVPIEDKIGHSRESKWEPRNLDIDIVFAALNDSLLFQNCTPLSFNINHFIVPHNDYENRKFWKKMVEKDLKYDPNRQSQKSSFSRHSQCRSAGVERPC